MEQIESKTIPAPNNSRAIPLLVIAIAMGLLGDWMLRSPQPGIGATVWTILLLAAGAYAVRRSNTPATKSAAALCAIAALFALLLSWRDSPTLRAVNISCIIVATGLAANYVFEGSLLKSTITSFFLDLTHSLAATIGGAILLTGSDIRWRDLSGGSLRSRFGGVARGFIVAIPLLLLFGTLFANSDAVFLSFVRDTSILVPDDLITHVVCVLGIAYIIAGLSRRAFIAPMLEPGTETLTIKPSYFTETLTALSLINLLFGLFVYVQFAYLFGGACFVQSRVGLTAAEYARSGFFELLAVVGISLPLLLTAHWLCGNVSRRQQAAFKALSLIYLALLSVIVASALCRMQVYCNAFGLTELRFYSTVTMIAISASLLLFAATVLTGRRRLFAPLCLGFLVVTCAGVNLTNPDAWIANANISRAKLSGGLDIDYALSLSDDAKPTLLNRIGELRGDQQSTLRKRMLADNPPIEDWRSWNYSRAVWERRILAE